MFHRTDALINSLLIYTHILTYTLIYAVKNTLNRHICCKYKYYLNIHTLTCTHTNPADLLCASVPCFSRELYPEHSGCFLPTGALRDNRAADSPGRLRMSSIQHDTYNRYLDSLKVKRWKPVFSILREVEKKRNYLISK